MSVADIKNRTARRIVLVAITPVLVPLAYLVYLAEMTKEFCGDACREVTYCWRQ